MNTDTMRITAMQTAKKAASLAALSAEVYNGLDIIQHATIDFDDIGAGSSSSVKEQAMALVMVGQSTAREIKQRMFERVAQTAWQLVKWEVAPHVRRSDEDGPIVWLTGNAYMPPLRSFSEAEVIWQAANESGDVWSCFADAFESACLEESIYVGAPDHDNALYGVDMRVWETIDNTDNEVVNISDDWQRKETKA